ncbi:hypothetical protein [Brachybacterium sp. UNK5269]|uniref:hypothetical protein n=1 Tax=Brachybacterium sp. UNK5269 TaxID=3408576 RepID=UPI003BB16A98
MDSTTSTDARLENPFGLVSLLAGLVLMVVWATSQALMHTMPFFHQYYDVPIGTWMLVSRIPPAILALIATVFGFIGLHARGKLSPAAAVGAALGSAYLMLGVADILGSVILAPLINTLEF